MDQHYISVSFTCDEEKAAIVSALLLDGGFEGMEEKGDGEYVLSIKEEGYNKDIVDNIFDINALTYSIEIIRQQNWNAAWESSFDPVVIGNFAAIRASFHPPVDGIVFDIIITPKMSFGTGHHATTFLMIQLMKDINFQGKQVIDFGTGTGVLAILAEKMGASAILAMDNDEWSISNSEENIAANGCNKIELQLAGEMVYREKVDIILANINLNVIIANIHKIKDAAKDGAWILLSGLLSTDEVTIREVLEANQLQVEKISHRNGWIALLTKN